VTGVDHGLAGGGFCLALTYCHGKRFGSIALRKDRRGHVQRNACVDRQAHAVLGERRPRSAANEPILAADPVGVEHCTQRTFLAGAAPARKPHGWRLRPPAAGVSAKAWGRRVAT
jgi:hypothetical protein